jgi:hypothetical protein
MINYELFRFDIKNFDVGYDIALIRLPSESIVFIIIGGSKHYATNDVICSVLITVFENSF